VGKSIAAKITELLATGKSTYYEELRSDVPKGLLEMFLLPG